VAVTAAVLSGAGQIEDKEAISSAQPPEEPFALETPVDDPYLAAPDLPRFPAAVMQRGPFASVQVNVDERGNNIQGDAGNEPSIAVDPTAPNRIAIGWRQFDTVLSNFRQAGYSFSRDGGRSWAGESIIEPGIFRSDPVLEAGPDGTFYYLSLQVTQGEFTCDMFLSDDGGATWPTKSFAFGGDKAWFAIDESFPGDGFMNQYQAWNTAGNLYFPNQFSRSVGGGESWEDPVEYDPFGDPPARPVFGLIDVGPDGSVYVAGSQNSVDTGTFWVVKSTNASNGAQLPTFGQITPIDLGGNLHIGAGPNPSGLLGQVNIVVDRSDQPTQGNVYVLCSVDPPGNDPMDVHLIRSEDGGQTWSEPVRVNDDGPLADAWQWFGQMDVAPNVRIDVIWNDTRNSGQDNISELFYAFSVDGGETWSENVVLSPPFNSHVGWPEQNKLGDYYDIISDQVGVHVAYAATFNGEQDVYYLRIGDYDCNDNGVGDSEDLANGTSGDCNGNGIADECEIAAGTLTDDDGDGMPDECFCLADTNGDQVVDVLDLIDVILSWQQSDVPADVNGDGIVDVLDLIQVILQWGPC
jgi:hypothetical protein